MTTWISQHFFVKMLVKMYKFCTYCGSKFTQEYPGKFFCSNCQKTTYLNSKPTVTVIPIFQNKEMLASIRAVQPHKGKLDFIGGFLENGEDVLKGAKREFKEETEMDIDPKKLKFLAIWIDTYNFQHEDFYTFNVIYTLEMSKRVKLEGKDDVASLEWLPIKMHKNFAFKWMKHAVKALKQKYSNI